MPEAGFPLNYKLLYEIPEYIYIINEQKII